MKKERHAKIIELVDSNVIETQEELTDMLNKAGVLATQATVSRDIRALHLTKVSNADGKQKYIFLRNEENYLRGKFARVLKDAVISMDGAQNILVVKTLSGMAMAVAAAIDAMKMPEVVGCIAGDDTVMAALKSTEDIDFVKLKIKEVIRS